MKCPECSSHLHFAADHALCEAGHQFPMKNGVYQVMTHEFAADVSVFLHHFEESRASEAAKYSPEILRNLPEATFDTGMWNLRKMDLELVLNLFQPHYKTALEVGAWNGWLSHHLVRLGLETTAVDLFVDALDGLGAKVHYHEDWSAIQMNLQELQLLDGPYDFIVVNRSIAYFTDMFGAVETLKSLLAPGGLLLITGMTYTTNASRIERELETAREAFKKQYGIPFGVNPFRGYLLNSDLKRMRQDGLQLRIYPKLRLQSVVGKLIASRPVYYYGLYQKP